MLHLNQATTAIVDAFSTCGTAGASASATGGGTGSGFGGFDLAIVFGAVAGIGVFAALIVGVVLFVAMRMTAVPDPPPLWTTAPTGGSTL